MNILRPSSTLHSVLTILYLIPWKWSPTWIFAAQLLHCIPCWPSYISFHGNEALHEYLPPFFCIAHRVNRPIYLFMEMKPFESIRLPSSALHTVLAVLYLIPWKWSPAWIFAALLLHCTPCWPCYESVHGIDAFWEYSPPFESIRRPSSALQTVISVLFLSSWNWSPTWEFTSC